MEQSQLLKDLNHLRDAAGFAGAVLIPPELVDAAVDEIERLQRQLSGAHRCAPESGNEKGKEFVQKVRDEQSLCAEQHKAIRPAPKFALNDPVGVHDPASPMHGADGLVRDVAYDGNRYLYEVGRSSCPLDRFFAFEEVLRPIADRVESITPVGNGAGNIIGANVKVAGEESPRRVMAASIDLDEATPDDDVRPDVVR